MNVWLHRHGRPSWKFAFNERSGFYEYETRANVYRIRLDNRNGYWVAKPMRDAEGNCWITCEHELRARSIEFESGGEWIFPKG